MAVHLRPTTRRPRGVAALPARIALSTVAGGLLACLLPVAAQALTISPLNGTPDASPHTQISFLGIAAAQLSHIAVVGSRSGAHPGRLQPYASAQGASFVPTRPFLQGELVRVSALAGPPRHTRRVHTQFMTARLTQYGFAASNQQAAATTASLKPRRGAVQSFRSAPGLQPPSVFVTLNSAAAGGGDVFLTPSHGYGQSGAMILDRSGGLVWFQPAPRGEIAMNLQAESYEGREVLVWWQGRVVLGVGFGTDVIYSSSYSLVAQVGAGNGYQADLHAVEITPQGSALITAYTFARADLSSVGGPRDGIVEDAIVQQIDIRSGLVMFEWHAYGHVPLSDSYSSPPSSSRAPYDYFHINSISPDPWGDGGFIISARNTWAAYEIGAHTGAILWRLGGKRSSFRMGAGTGTAWQHDVRWQPDSTLTLFDNGAVPKEHSQSRVLHERIDFRHRSVSLVGRDVHTPALLSGSQGSAELMSGGGWFVGWGEAPFFSEFASSGQLVFDAHLLAPGQSYRAYRFPWSGAPGAPPSLAVQSSGAGAVTVYASWNGATDVNAWRVLAGVSPASLALAAVAQRAGFETAIPVPLASGWFAVQAIGAEGQVLATSPVAHH